MVSPFEGAKCLFFSNWQAANVNRSIAVYGDTWEQSLLCLRRPQV